MGKQLHYGGPQTSHPFCLLEMRFPSLGVTYISGRSLRACVFSFPVCLPWTTPGRQNQLCLLQHLCQMVAGAKWALMGQHGLSSGTPQLPPEVSKQCFLKITWRMIQRGWSSLIVLVTRLVLEISCYNGSFKETRLLNLFVGKNKEFLPTQF